MGAVLEMRQAIMVVVAALSLSACGQESSAPQSPSDAEARALSIVAKLQAIFGGVGSDNSIGLPRSIPGGFTPEAIAAEPGAYRLVQINALGLQEPARVIQENGAETTLALQPGPTAAFDQGILVSTRGFGDDLYTMESAGLINALRAGGGSLTRRMEFLDAQDQIHLQTFTCAVTAAGAESVNLGLREVTLQRLDEECRSEAIIFDNIYWLDRSGAIVSSRQYVSPTVAYLRSNRL